MAKSSNLIRIGSGSSDAHVSATRPLAGQLGDRFGDVGEVSQGPGRLMAVPSDCRAPGPAVVCKTLKCAEDTKILRIRSKHCKVEWAPANSSSLLGADRRFVSAESSILPERGNAM